MPDGTTSGDDSTALDAGWAALKDRRWEDARAAFDAAIAEEGSAEALEGLSWALWWLDDADGVLDARARAYRRYRDRGASAAAGRMATWLAVDHLDFRGASAAAGGWLRRAHRLLDDLETGAEHGWLAFHDGYLAHVRGEPATAADLGGRAAGVGRRLGVPDLEMLGLALQGASLVALARVDDGMGCLDEATATAIGGGAEVPISTAWTFCFAVTACATVRDFDRGFEWCGRIAEFADRHQSRYMRASCRADLGTVHLWQGRWDEAEQALKASAEDFCRSRPAFAGAPLAGLAELRRRQGRRGEAEELLDQAGPGDRPELCRARLVHDRGDAVAAAEMLTRLLRRLPGRPSPDRAPVLEALVRARASAGEPEGAAAALAELREIERLVGTPALRAAADLAEGIVAAAGGDHERARPALEDAVDRFGRIRAPFDAAVARLELAATLHALGRREAAAAEAGDAVTALARLGAVTDAERGRRLLARIGAGDGRGLVTRREREVLGLLAEGLTDRQIAERLVLSEHTVHRHVTNILRKLNLRSRAAAAAKAVSAGLLDA